MKIRIAYKTFAEASLARRSYLTTSPDAKVEIYCKKTLGDRGEMFELVIHPADGLTEQIVKGRLLDQLYSRSMDDC